MAAYDSLASVYDLFMEDVDYESWCRYLTGILRKNGIEDGLLCELGCGTGTMTELLSRSGYDLIGVDNSPEMLTAAQEKKDVSGSDILYLLQDMREFELYGTVRAVISVCDSMNYILEEEDLLRVFQLADNYLDPGGLLLFDVNTAAKYEAIGDSVIAESREEASFIWENSYDPGTCLNEYCLTLFLPEGEDGLYRRHEEVHTQRAWSAETLRRLIEEAGMAWIGMQDAYTGQPAAPDSERILIAAREIRKGRTRTKDLTEEQHDHKNR